MSWREAFLGMLLAAGALGAAGAVVWKMPLPPAQPTSAPSPSGAQPPQQETLVQECRREAGQLARRLGGGFELLVRPPFVLAGDLPPPELDRWWKQTVAPAYHAMRHSYLKHLPQEPIAVVILAHRQSYRQTVQRLFAQEPVSPYGFYKPGQRIVVVNAATGSGTLVHELTHALMDFDFPQAPDWFSEGLGSLHEQCRFLPQFQGLEGLVNWRLPGLQKALAQGRLRSLQELVQEKNFRRGNVGLNYAHARYFCMYMQHRGVLEEFYRRFRDGFDQDPSGAQFVEELLGPWDQLEQEFRTWVKHLRYEP